MLHPQAALVQDGAVIDDDGIVKRPAKREAGILHRGDVAHHAEGACRREIADEASIAVAVVEPLAPDCRIGEIDFGVDLEAVAGFDLRPAASMLDRHRRGDDKNAAPCGKLDDSGAVDGFDNRKAAAVKNGGFAAVDVDDGVIDAKTGKGRHDMFNGFQAHAVVIDDAGAQPGLLDVVRGRGNRLAAFRDVNTPEGNSGIGRSRVDRDANEATGMQPDAVKGDGGCYGRLHWLFAVHLGQGSAGL